MNIQGWFPLRLTGLISLQSKGLSRAFSSNTVWKHQFCGAQPSLWLNSHLYPTTEKTIALTVGTFVSKEVFLLSNKLSRFAIAVAICSDFRVQENKICHCFHFFPRLFATKYWFWMPWSQFLNVKFQARFFTCLFSLSSGGSFVPLHFLPLEW